MRKELQKLLADQACLKPNEVMPKSKLRKDLNLDSLDMMEVIIDLEVEFDMKIPEPDAAEWETVCDIEMYIIGKKGVEYNE